MERSPYNDFTAGIEQYARLMQIELAKSFQGRAKVYLDTRFWIILREGKTPEASELLRLLREGVTKGKIFCPLSSSTLLEILRQPYTPTRRIGTAIIVDELSLGVSVVSTSNRATTEFAHFVLMSQGKTDLFAVNELIWTKIGHSLGYLFPIYPDLNMESNIALQQKVFEDIWNSSMSEIIKRLGEGPEELGNPFADTAQRLTRDIQAHADKLISYKRVYVDEVAGAVDLLRDEFAEFICEQSRNSGFHRPPKGSLEWYEARRYFGNVVVNALKLSPEARNIFQTIHIEASLHAGLRWNKGRNFKANDFFDFEHATVALAYCDAFFTEKSLTQLITSNHMRLNEINNCSVTSEIKEAIEITKRLIT